MTAHQKNFIAGEWVDGTGITRDINPSNTTDVVGEYAKADKAQTEKAIAAAKAAFPTWARSTPQERFDALTRISVEILARKEELGRLLAREEGKTLPEGIGEVARAGQIFAFFAGEALRLLGEKGASVRPGLDVEITREPVGVVGMITPWNFPIAIPAWKIAPALCYGNAVVFKPAELVPGSAHALSEIIARSGIPAGVFNLVVGSGSVVGQTLLDHPDVAAISFTGSVQTGRKIAQACVLSNPMKKFQLEMGGKNPLVVLDDADVKVAVEVAVNGAYFSTGQRCTASSRLIVTAGIHDRFVAQEPMANRAAVPLDQAASRYSQVPRRRIAAHTNCIKMLPLRFAELVGQLLLTRRSLAAIDKPPPINPSRRKSTISPGPDGAPLCLNFPGHPCRKRER
ncbi:acyl-CoA reductase-like NAD-dependent aldehyde dehydrogenase [Bradyrhizobium sp. USDA 4508]